MKLLLVVAVALLSFANGANDNFKGVATLWGAGRTSYGRALAWATAFTFMGSLGGIWLGSGLAAKFSGEKFVDVAIYTQLPFLAAVALATGATVLLASRLGLPISTTHAMTGALLGAGVSAAGFSQVKFATLVSGIVLPLLLSPIAASILTVGVYSLVVGFERGGTRDCVCVDQPQAVMTSGTAVSAYVMATAAPSVRWAAEAECETGLETVHFNIAAGMHWFSGAAISFARGLNDTPKIAAVLLVAAAGAIHLDYLLVALAMGVGGLLGAVRIAQTMSKEITPMATRAAVSANLVAATLVTLATTLALPVSTTQVTLGGIFGIALLRRREADWRRVRDIVFSWLATLPLGAVLGVIFYRLLHRSAGL